MTEGYIHGRVRIYTGPKHVLNGSSVGGPGPFQNVQACFYKETEELIILDDHVVIFDIKVVENGIFNSYRENEISDLYYSTLSATDISLGATSPNMWCEHEPFAYHLFKSRGAKFNLIGIDMEVIGRRQGSGIVSGHVNMKM